MSNLKDIYNKVKQQTQQVLNNEVSDKIKEIEHKHVISDVYAQYSPTMYQRKKDNYGLSDESNMLTKQYGEIGIEISNDTYHDNLKSMGGNYVADVVESGVGYEYAGYGYPYEEPRPFQEKTVEELNQSKEHVIALKQGLKNKGINTD